ncbi:Peptidase family M23 [Modestobacter sp. DSM 44400]|uniref:M23 family metallopeptidase n=1 Tax=Modestobacter sp. DSM 44400 TaxID=1550230 RepID=UPI00089C5393|nr:M23 family metallopeptidase [Modestobacter sp. DSM 44400]SDX51168.1 Peptidase family M23 [Modestobacter sp. DSM 44400]
MSRLNELAGRSSGPTTAAPSGVGLVIRPRTAAAARDTYWDTDASADWRLSEPDWDRSWASTRTAAAADDLADLDEEYLDVLEVTDPDDDSDTNTDTDTDEAQPRAARLRRFPATPRRRPAMLLAAAVAGAVLSGATGIVGPGASTTSATGQDYGLGLEETGFAGGSEVAGARGEISQAEAQARLDEIAASRAAREPKFVLPTQGRLTTCFCTRWGTMHWGIDLAAPLGTPIVAAADGVVLRAGPASGYGNAVYIQDADGNVEIYGHMRYIYVEAGDVVSAGYTIAKVGSEGQSTGPHLHFEIHKGGMNGKPTDPEDWLADRGISVG